MQQPASEELLRAEFAQLQRELRDCGDEVASVAALTKFEPRPDAQRVLARSLRSVQHHQLRDFIARALTERKLERDVLDSLVAAFDDELHPMTRWAIGNAIATAASGDNVDTMLRLVSESGYGISRQMMVLRLKNWATDPKVEDVLIVLTKDEDVAGHAARALGAAKTKRALEALNAMATNENTWVRSEAHKAATHVSKRLQALN